MSDRDWFKEWFNSVFYHKLYFERDENEAKQFILRLLDHFKPPADARMLDIACGRGRHSRILAANGFDVTGIDLAAESIRFAKQFETENLHFFQHDMRLPSWINYFDFAFNFFTSFGYFATRREHDDSIRTIVQSIKPSGTLVIDYLNVHFSEERLVPAELKKIGSTEYEIVRWQDNGHFYKKMQVRDPGLDHSLEFTEKVAKLSLGDFTEMLSFHKMQVSEVFGDYHLNAYDIRKTPRMIIVARKPVQVHE